MSLMEKQAMINRKLAELDPRYAIANLRLAERSSGRYEFDIVSDFDGRHMKAVEGVLQSVLGIRERDADDQVPTTVLLPRPAYQKLQRLQRTRHKSQSQVVAELLLNA